VTSYARFEERSKNEYFNEDTKKETNRSFLNWIENSLEKTSIEMNYCENLRRNIINYY
jgi:hypothetical protein